MFFEINYHTASLIASVIINCALTFYNDRIIGDYFVDILEPCLNNKHKTYKIYHSKYFHKKHIAIMLIYSISTGMMGTLLVLYSSYRHRIVAKRIEDERQNDMICGCFIDS